jgi:uncharacterized membrane protein/CheY-like chemotaxis protein
MTDGMWAGASMAGASILVVDDDRDLREELAQFLQDQGLQVETADDIGSAQYWLERRAFDLVLLDLWLGRDNGFDLLRAVRKTSDIPCIVMTAQDGVTDRLAGLNLGADDYLFKPLDPKTLLTRIASLLRSSKARAKHGPIREFASDRKGAISIVAALSIAMLVGIAALVVDAGSLYAARRNLQAASDAAAMAAVQNPSSASAIAASVFAGNGFSGQTLTVTTGVYTPDETLSASNRFAASTTNINAVRVRASIQKATFFSPFFGLGRNMTLVTQSTAARVPTASFGAGTGLANLNAGLLNAVLGQLWGSTVSLGLVDYQSLVNTNIEAVPFLNQLATDVGVSGSYQQLANTHVTEGQILNALIETVNSSGAHGNPSGALFALKGLQLQLTGNTSILVSNLIDIAPLTGRTIGNIVTVTDPSLQLNLMGLLSASARTVAAGRLVNIGSAVTIPVTNSTISTRLAVGNQMTQVSMAKVGSTIQTAQIRLALTATILNLNLAGIATTTVTVPLYLEGASGQATLTAMPCTAGGDRAQIAASSGATTLKFGTVSDAALQNFSATVTPVATPVIGVTLLTIPVQFNISGSTTVAASGPTTLDFTQSDIANGTVKTVPAGSATPFHTLSGNFTITPSVSGNPLIAGLVSGLTSALTPVVTSLISPLDAPVAQIMATLGLALGTTDVRVFDVSCRTPTLVG